jgi:signal transduction histidine kinase
MNTDVFLHEIKNSLSNIYVISDLLLLEDDPNETKKLVKLIKSSVDQIKSIEIDYNMFRKLGRETIELSTVNVSTLLSSVIDEFKPIAAKANVELSYIPKACRVYTDKTKLRQVIANFVSNAIKYSNPKSSVVVTCVSLGNHVSIVIKDNGIGMASEELKLLGTPFFRSKRIVRDGTGLGWAFIKKTCQLLNWTYDVQSVVGKGTTVTLDVLSG